LKPMGTITKYYPFIDEETKGILNSLMEGSSSYYDFVQQLCEVVLNNDVPVNLAYLATVQAWWCRMRSTAKLLGEKYGDVPYIQPWVYVVDSGERDQVLVHDVVVEHIEKAIEHSIENWMEVDLHILHAFLHHPFGEVISLYEPLDKVKDLIATHPHLGCFESVLYAFEAIAKLKENNINDALEIVQKGKSLAKRHDDALYMYMNMLQEALVLSVVDVNKSASMFEDLYELVQELQIPAFETEILNDSSLLYETMGEFDLVISCHHEMMKILDGSDRRISDTTFIILARSYATLGDGQLALEWINKGMEDSGQFASAQMLICKAWALALVNRIDEAEKALENAYQQVIKTSFERHLADYYHVSGVIEQKNSNFLNALNMLEKAWEITNKLGAGGTNRNRVLIDLARVENLTLAQSKDDAKTVAPGKWLSTLEKYACERDLPGIKMYAALLKSEFYQNHGQLKDALATLQDALDITDSLGVQTLRFKINSRIKEIDQLLQDGEMIS
jgi:tetratricopeptide (TPR) repeat protein